MIGASNICAAQKQGGPVGTRAASSELFLFLLASSWEAL